MGRKRYQSCHPAKTRTQYGGGGIDLFPLTGVAGWREIAAALDMPADEYAALWPDLPLDDTEIARRMGATRQQVINLRKAARARLARRMKDAGEEEPQSR